MNIFKNRPLLMLITWILVMWSFLGVNIIPEEFNLLVHINIFIHATALIISTKYIFEEKVPFLFLISIFNLFEYGIVLLIIPMEDFQLSRFDYNVLYDLSVGFTVFYFFFFIFKFFQNKKETISSKSRKIDEIYLKYFLIVLFALTFIIDFPISGLNEIFELSVLGYFFSGFIREKNNFLDNLAFAVILIYLVIQQIISGMIFAIVYLGIFMLCIYLIYGIKKWRATIFMVISFFLIGLFSKLFSEVKFDYRQEGYNLETTGEKLSLISTLIQNKKEVRSSYIKSEIEIRETTSWRLSYALSAISLVYSKTPVSVPYWEGESYTPILTKLIPRFIWQDKPKEDMGQRFGHTYQILNKLDTSTSMNTPILAEAYMNFGFFGILIILIIVAALFSSIFKKYNSKKNIIGENSLDSIILAHLGVICIMWESNLSMMIGKIIILFFLRFTIIRIFTWTGKMKAH